MWGAVVKVDDHPLVGHAALQERISQVVRQMEQEEVARACSRLRLRLGVATGWGWLHRVGLFR